MNKNFLIVLSSPSGGGKTTLCNMVLNNFEDIKYSISATTRPKRKNEIDGKHYFFMTEEEFKEKEKQGFFIETALVHNYYYGTPKNYIENTLKSGFDIIMDVDVQGAISIMEIFPDALTIFIKPPSIEELEKRLRNRGTDSEEVIKQRLENAKKEMEYAPHFKYVVVNDDLNTVFEKIKQIINNERKIRRS